MADVELVEVRHHVREVDHRQALGVDRVEDGLLEEGEQLAVRGGAPA